jgi:hypothetical protein
VTKDEVICLFKPDGRISGITTFQEISIKKPEANSKDDEKNNTKLQISFIK